MGGIGTGLSTRQNHPLFFESHGEIYEALGSPIATSEGLAISSTPHGYLVISRRGDQKHLQLISELTGSDVTLADGHEHGEAHPPELTLHVHREILDLPGQVLRLLVVSYRSPELLQVATSDRWEADFSLQSHPGQGPPLKFSFTLSELPSHA